MKTLMSVLFLLFIFLQACNKDGILKTASPGNIGEPIQVRTPPCNEGDYFAGVSWNLGKCKHDCNRGIGFNCGKTKYVCSNGIMTEWIYPDGCGEAYIEPEDWVTVGILSSGELSDPRVIDIQIQFLSRYTAKFTFLEPLPNGELAYDDELSIEYPLRYELNSPLMFGLASVNYIEFLVGDYQIDSTSTTYGSALVDVTAYQ
jgi:hypothetical protein